MICPVPSCKAEIPDDSFFCDQCGIQLKRCTKCFSVGYGKFCGKCGAPMKNISELENQKQSLEKSPK